jgi:peptide/nickel transport system substrate-binding protein
VDDATVEFKLSGPDALFLQYLASINATPLSPKAFDLEQTVLESGGPELAGIGPFVLTSFTANTEITFEKRDDYAWAPASLANKDGAAHLDKVTYRTFAEGSTRTGALEQGQVQIASDIQPLDVEVFDGREGFQYIRNHVSGLPYALYLKVSDPPLDDVRVREAFIRGADLDAIVDSVYSGAFDRAWAPVSERGPWADPALEGWSSTDVDRANELLDEAGWTGRDSDGFRTKGGKKLLVRTVTEAPYVRESRDQVNLAISAALKENVGIDYQYEVVDVGSGAARQEEGSYEAFDNSRGDPDPGAGVDLLYHSDPSRGFLARGRFNDPELDALIDSGRFTTDLDTRVTAYKELQGYVTTESFYVLPIYQTQDNLAASAKVHDIFIDGNGQPLGAYKIWLAS